MTLFMIEERGLAGSWTPYRAVSGEEHPGWFATRSGAEIARAELFAKYQRTHELAKADIRHRFRIVETETSPL